MYYIGWMAGSAGMLTLYAWDFLGYAHSQPKVVGDTLGMAFWLLVWFCAARAYRAWQRRI